MYGIIFAQFLAQLVLLGLVVVLLHKTRQIHLATFDLKSAGRETKTLFAQIQALLALERKLAMVQALPPLRGWAGSPDFLLVVAEEVTTRKPRVVMECSSGVSTLVIARCLQLMGSGHVYSLEHDPRFAAATRKLIERYKLDGWATVIDAPLERRGGGTPWYAEACIPNSVGPVEILVVDGPPAKTASMARYPALPTFRNSMCSKSSILILDDADRPDERATVKRWCNEFPDAIVTDRHCEKGCVTLEFGSTVG